MSSPHLWIGFAAAFVVAGLLNLARARRESPGHGVVRRWLAASCLAWAATSLLYRYASIGFVVAAAALAALMMLASAAASFRGPSPRA